MKVIQRSEQSEHYLEVMNNCLDPVSSDFISLEKISVLVGNEISEAVFFGCLDSIRRNNPRKPVSYFFGALRKCVPNLYGMLADVFVKP